MKNQNLQLLRPAVSDFACMCVRLCVPVCSSKCTCKCFWRRLSSLQLRMTARFTGLCCKDCACARGSTSQEALQQCCAYQKAVSALRNYFKFASFRPGQLSFQYCTGKMSWFGFQQGEENHFAFSLGFYHMNLTSLELL